MSIISISRIQLRRGLKTDLPINLAEAELGWCLDTRELFIGNGTTFNGNSEILTQWSPNDQLITHAYQGSTSILANTGIFPNAATYRSIGEIFDDIVCVKDYGAKGDGVTDDTEAIQNSINDAWNAKANNPSGQASLKAIYFPAGNYLISNTIYVRPFIGIIGEGSTRTIFIMSTMINNPYCLISTADSAGQIQNAIGTGGAILPTGIILKGFQVNSNVSASLNGIVLQRTSNSRIDDILSNGLWQSGQNPLTNNTIPFTSGIVVQTLGSLNNCDNIVITNYYAQNIASGFYCNDIARYIVIDTFNISSCFRGISLEQNTILSTNGPSYVRVINGTFKNLDEHGIHALAPNCGAVSNNNAYDTVGNVTSVTPITFGPSTSGCASINDMFSNTLGNLITIGNPQLNLFISPQQVSIASNAPIPIGPITLLDNSTEVSTGISYSYTLFNNIFINYNIVRGTASRSGKLMIISNGINVDFEDFGIDLRPTLYGTVGVTWSMAIVASSIIIYYTTTSIGINGTLTYIETKW